MKMIQNDSVLLFLSIWQFNFSFHINQECTKQKQAFGQVSNSTRVLDGWTPVLCESRRLLGDEDEI